MRNLLAFLGALTLTLAGVGWYLDWYKVRSSPTPSGQRGVTIDINTGKIGKDLLQAEQGLQKKLAERSKQQESAENKAPAKAEKNAPAEVEVGTEDSHFWIEK